MNELFQLTVENQNNHGWANSFNKCYMCIYGKTNLAGEFRYLPGETLTLSIGELSFPPVLAQELISPVELAENANNSEATKINIARLLQSLDADGNLDNGIQISTSAIALAAPIDFDVSTEEFQNNDIVTNMVANSGDALDGSLVSVVDTVDHLNQTLQNLEQSGNEGEANTTEGLKAFGLFPRR